MKEIEEHPNKWKDIPCSWIGRMKVVKISILPKAVYIFSAIPIKFPWCFSKKQENKFVWNYKHQITRQC